MLCCKHLFCLIFLPFLLFSCKGKVETDNLTDLTVIELDLDKTEVLYLDSIVHNVRFVPLQTSSECLIERYSDIRLAGRQIFIHSKSPIQNAIFVFDLNGHFLFKVDSRGRGPGEYREILGFQIDLESEELAIADVNKILFYDFEGRFLRSHNTAGLYSQHDLVYFDEKYFMCALSLEDFKSSDHDLNFIAIHDKDFNLLSHTFPVAKRYIEKLNAPPRRFLIPNKDTLFFLHPEVPIIYTYHKESFLPRYSINYAAYSVSKGHEEKFYEFDGPDLAAYEYARSNKLALPGSEVLFCSDKYYLIESYIYDNVYRFLFNPANGKTARIQGRSSTHRAMYPVLIRCYENQFFGIKEASGILHSRDRLIEFKNEKSAMSLDLSGPFSHTHFSRFDSIKPDDNAIIVFFDIKDDFLK
jgi:hypothetical protein